MFRCFKQLWLTSQLACQIHCVIHLGSAAETAVNKHSYCPHSKQSRGHMWLALLPRRRCRLCSPDCCFLGCFNEILSWQVSNPLEWEQQDDCHSSRDVLFACASGLCARNAAVCQELRAMCFTHSSAELYIKILFLLKSLLKQLEKEERERWKPQQFVPLCKQFRFSFPTVQPMGVRRNTARSLNLLG